MDYNTTIAEHKRALEERIARGDVLTAKDILRPPLDFTQDNRSLFEWAMSTKLVARQDIVKAQAHHQHRRNVIDVLGSYPSSSMEFIETLAVSAKIEVRYNGSISRADMSTGERLDALITDIARDARLTATTLKLTFGRDDITDAVEAWYARARRARLMTLRSSIARRAEFDWLRLASLFETSSQSPEFVAACLRKLVHQVVCKLDGRPVEHHLMLVITGGQGKGKTYLVRKLIEPLIELVRAVDFRAISDERNIEIWSSYVHFLDEMAHATKADVEVVKNVITADYLDRRPMRTNSVQQVRQCATMIACSNKDVGEMIKDETGARRFVGIEFTASEEQRAIINDMDFLAAWRSIKSTDADPMDEFRTALRDAQEETRYLSPVEDWLRALTGDDVAGLVAQHGSNKLTPPQLYDHYLAHRRAVVADRDPQARDLNQFSRELGRLHKQAPDRSPLRHARAASGIVYQPATPIGRLSVIEGDAR